MLRIVEAKIKGQTRVMKFTLFGDLIKKGKEDTGYSMTYLRVGKYNNVQYLKTTKSTAFILNDDIDVVVTENFSLDGNIDTTISVRICAVYMKSFNTQYTCPNCSSEIISDEEYVVCDNYDTISLLSDCQSSVAICFTGEIANEKLLFQSKGNLIPKYFQLPVIPKTSLAKAMLNKNVDIVYQPKEKNIVKDMKPYFINLL